MIKGKIPQGKFTAIYKKLSPFLVKFISKRVGADKEAVEEVFSETILAAWKGFSAFKHKSSYFTWLCRIALNKTADYYRGQVNRDSAIIAPLLEDIAQIRSNEPSPEERLALEEIRASVRRALDLLPDEKRQVLYLRYWRDLTVKQIAKTLGVSERSIEGKIYRAKNLLRDNLAVISPSLERVYRQ